MGNGPFSGPGKAHASRRRWPGRCCASGAISPTSASASSSSPFERRAGKRGDARDGGTASDLALDGSIGLAEFLGSPGGGIQKIGILYPAALRPRVAFLTQPLVFGLMGRALSRTEISVLQVLVDLSELRRVSIP
jgi:hypothetical protein